QQYPDAPPDAAFNYVLMLLVDVRDPGLTILPTHRILHDLDRFDATELLRRLSARHRVVSRDSRAALLAAMQQVTPTHRIGKAFAIPSPAGGGEQGGGYYTIDIDQRG